MRSMPCGRRCVQDATSTRDTRTVLSSAVLGVCFAGTQPVSKRLRDPRLGQVECRSETSDGGANGKIMARASQFALRADPLFVRVVSRLFCTHIVLSVEHGQMFYTCFEGRNITSHGHWEHMTHQT